MAVVQSDPVEKEDPIVYPLWSRFVPVKIDFQECRRFVTPVRHVGSLVDITEKQKSGEPPPRVAVCLYGEARRFELTGPSIKRYVLDILPHADVFVNSPLDRDSHKLSFLHTAKPHFAKARIFTPTRLPETKLHREIIDTDGSSHGLQGLLHFFSLIEECGTMIYEYEKRHDFRYEWIVKLRLDSYWSAPIPTRYERGVYTVPYGNNCGGVNDKLGVADRGTAMSAGLKLSILPALHAVGDRSLWPEALFESHLEMQHTLPVPANFSFCLIDHRKWPFPPEGWHLSIPSLASVGPLNGAYCRPCQPKVENQEQSAAIVESLCKRSGWFPTQGMSSFSLCDATKLEWEDGWEDVFDRAAGEEAAEARRRMSRRKKPFPDCVSDVTTFKERCQVWDAPTPHQICTVKSQNPWPKATPTSS